jgi:hypothetical protein
MTGALAGSIDEIELSLGAQHELIADSVVISEKAAVPEQR